MFEPSKNNPATIIAVGLGANKGFWMIQPRDDGGQWIEMGASVLFRFRTGDGNLVVGTARGVYIGPSGRPGFARVLVDAPQDSGIEPGVYNLESRNLQQFIATLPGEAVDGVPSAGRKDKFGKPVKTLSDNQLPVLDNLLEEKKPITEEDKRLARGELTPEEREAEASARADSPIADLPAGFEAENPEKVLELLKEAGVDVDSLAAPEGDATPEVAPKVNADRGEKPKAYGISRRPESDTNEGVMPFGRSSERDRIALEKQNKNLINPQDAVVQKAYLDSYAPDAKTPSVDDLADQSLALFRNLNSSERKEVFDLKPGDKFIDSDGDQFTVLENRVSPTNLNRVLVLQKQDGSTSERDLPGFEEVNVLPESDQPAVRRPERPAAPAATPEQPVDAVPEDAPEPEAPEVVTPTAPENVSPESEDSDGIDPADLVTAEPGGGGPPNFPPKNRMDDGIEFEMPVLSNEELRKARKLQLSPIMDPDGTPVAYVNEFNEVVEAEDPFAMIDALGKIYPNAKFTEDGSLVLHRQKDKDGRIFELRASNSGKKALVYSMRWTDPETGEYKEYQHKDDRHSITALLRKDNGPQGLLDRLLGRVDNDGKDWGDPKNYFFGNSKFKKDDSLFKRLRWFMSGTGDRKKMEEIGKNAVRLAEGNNAIYHKNTKKLKHQEIPELWSSFDEYIASGQDRESRDLALKEDLYHVLYSIFGRVPLNEKSHALVRTAIRDEFARRNPNIDLKTNQSFQGLITSASERMRGIYRDPSDQTRAIRYSSKDRTRPIERGQVVEYTNNVGEKSTVKVVGLVENLNVTPGDRASYDYGDYVIVQDANGNKRKINALKLQIMSDQNKSLTAYIPNLRGADLDRRRREIDGDPKPIPTTSPLPPPPVGTNTVVSDPAPPPRLIDDFVQGDMLYNKSGQPLGIIKVAPRAVTSRDGSSALAFLYTAPNGTEGSAIYKLGTEIKPKKA